MGNTSRRKFLGSVAAAGAVSLGSFSGCGTQAPEKTGREQLKDMPSHPLQGIARENIKITDIKVTPLSYVHDGDYLWRCGGLLV